MIEQRFGQQVAATVSGARVSWKLHNSETYHIETVCADAIDTCLLLSISLTKPTIASLVSRLRSTAVHRT